MTKKKNTPCLVTINSGKIGIYELAFFADAEAKLAIPTGTYKIHPKYKKKELVSLRLLQEEIPDETVITTKNFAPEITLQWNTILLADAIDVPSIGGDDLAWDLEKIMDLEFDIHQDKAETYWVAMVRDAYGDGFSIDYLKVKNKIIGIEIKFLAPQLQE
jgi:hypothetical protein